VLGSIPTDVETILSNPKQAVSQFLERRPVRTLHFLGYHAPFLILLPLFMFLSPYRLLMGNSLSRTTALFPVILILGFLALGAVFDRLQRYSNAAGLDPDRQDFFAMRPTGKNLSLFLHLPLSASAFLFFLHPLPGFLGLLITGIYCAHQSVVAWARLRQQTILESLSAYILSAGLTMLPVLALVLLYNLLKTAGIFRDLYL